MLITTLGRDCSGEYKSLTTEARSLSNLLEDVQDKYSKIPANKRQQLADAYEPCVEVLEELDKLLLHYNSLDTKSKRAWDRLKWDPDRSRVLRERLASSVALLNAFYTALIHDNQVLILEALERLEKDYKGGHREESIASLHMVMSGVAQDQDEDDDAAWTQILRDLEDVGVTQQQAVGYRAVIVDWLVAAINEGRLLEERPESEGLATMPRALRSALPSLTLREESASVNLDLPATTPFPHGPSEHRSNSLQGDYLNPAAVYLLDSASRSSSPGRRSSSPGRRSPNSDTASLYADPRPPMLSVRSGDFEDRTGVSLTPSATHDYNVQSSSRPSDTHTPSMAHFSSLVSTTELPDKPANMEPPGYYKKSAIIRTDLKQTAERIVDAWGKKDYITAGKYLEDQLAAVEHGITTLSGTQPDRRVLRYLVGVCASIHGDFAKAKHFFGSVFNGIYLNRDSLDDGDVAAARWLGDTCLYLREYDNAILAYSVAYEGSIRRFGLSEARTRRVALELRLIDHWLFAFKSIKENFRLDHDPTDIFTSTHATERRNLLILTQAGLYKEPGFGDVMTGPPPLYHEAYPTFGIAARPRLTQLMSNGFVLEPLVPLSAWPMPWDPTFSPQDLVQLHRYMNRVPGGPHVRLLVARQLPKNNIGDSKKFHYVTKRGSVWLVRAVQNALEQMGIEYTEYVYDTSIICCRNQLSDGFAYAEGIEIMFRKLQFRSIHGIRISDVKWATRDFATIRSRETLPQRDTTEFRNKVKSFLEAAEAKAGR